MSKKQLPFALNFNNDKKIVSVTLPQEEAVFQLAEAFSKWLTENNIENVVTEKPIIDTTKSEDYGNPDALPILEELNVPFTIFVNSAMINGEINAWWLGLRNLIRTQDKVHVESMNCQFNVMTLPEKRTALFQITNWVHEDISTHSKQLNCLFKKFKILFYVFNFFWFCCI